jgi:peptidoglycan/xylan/chitin deacetylase (PgdA/CDA1 family)
MSTVTKAVRLALQSLHLSGLAQAARPVTQGQGVIFCLHHIYSDRGEDSGFFPNANLASTPEFLDAALTGLRRRGYEFISIGDVPQRLADGYLNNLQHAAPVFQAHGCPYTVYVAPGLIDATTEMWWTALEDMIRAGRSGNLSIGDHKVALPCASDADKWAAWHRLAGPLHAMPEHEQRLWVRHNAARLGIDLARQCRDVFMTWDDVRRMAADPLATIGAHTNNHLALKKLPADEALAEMAHSGQRISSEIGKQVQHFAYPYGNVAHAGPRDFALAQQAGFATAVTTRLGTVFSEHAAHLHALPRVMVSGKYQKSAWLNVLASGLPGYVKNRGRLNVG